MTRHCTTRSTRGRWRGRARTAVAALALGAACGGEAPRPARGAPVTATDTVAIFAAASLAGPLRSIVRTHRERAGALVTLESGGSLEHARKVTKLGRVPDLLILADQAVFPQGLMPRHVVWYLRFARDRVVIAYTTRSRHASEITDASWPAILRRPDAEVGRPDPARAPAGNVRPDAAQLAALLETGEVDHVLEYESLARARGFRYVRLPPDADLGDPARADAYAAARVRVPRGPRGDSVTIAGAPILLTLSVPLDAPHPSATRRFVAAMLSPAGRATLRAAGVDLLAPPQGGRVTQQGPPAEVFHRPGPRHAVLRAEEVLVAREPVASSARNVLAGVVRELHASGPVTMVTVDVRGTPMVAALTTSAARELGLAEGAEAWVAFEASAVHLC